MPIGKLKVAAIFIACMAFMIGGFVLSARSAPPAPPRPAFEGAPAIGPGIVRGYFVWHDDAGWHVRWTTKGVRHQFSGTLSCRGEFREFVPVSADRRDWISLQADRRRAAFDTITGSGQDGFDFRLTPATRTVTFDLSIDGQRITPAEIFLGASMSNPRSNPFTLER
jgi:hypothetical protein